jgi:tungstate transport system substrate-binding protein
MAKEKDAYTLTDRGTYLALRKELDLEILSEREPVMQNTYSVVIVNPAKHPHLNSRAAEQFAEFLADPETKAIIAKFGVEKYGEPLFYPAK